MAYISKSSRRRSKRSKSNGQAAEWQEDAIAVNETGNRTRRSSARRDPRSGEQFRR